ncbi:MAG TPA: CSLREA domain-containing protein, partial [Anaerolineales bacterium]|nr:CSLREA domain-containing protein [Anaerolineales bacterium]
MSAKSLFRLAWQTTRIAVLLALVLGAVFASTQTATARAMTFTVNTTADTTDASPGNGVCADASSQCSLRAAITEANALAGADTISLPAGTYQLTRANAGNVNEDGNSTGDLDINSTLTITGAGSGSTFIQAGTSTSDGIDKVLGVNPYCASGVSVTIEGVTIRYGRNTQPWGAADYGYTGGGLDWCAGSGSDSFTLRNAVVSDNTNVNGYGGGLNIDSVSNYTGTITIDTVTFQNNNTTGTVNDTGGGALNVFGDRPNITISNSTFTNNHVASSTSRGGALYLGPRYGGSVQIHNSLIQGNTTNSDGGGIAV